MFSGVFNAKKDETNRDMDSPLFKTSTTSSGRQDFQLIYQLQQEILSLQDELEASRRTADTNKMLLNEMMEAHAQSQGQNENLRVYNNLERNDYHDGKSYDELLGLVQDQDDKILQLEVSKEESARGSSEIEELTLKLAGCQDDARRLKKELEYERKLKERLLRERKELRAGRKSEVLETLSRKDLFTPPEPAPFPDQSLAKPKLTGREQRPEREQRRRSLSRAARKFKNVVKLKNWDPPEPSQSSTARVSTLYRPGSIKGLKFVGGTLSTSRPPVSRQS